MTIRPMVCGVLHRYSTHFPVLTAVEVLIQWKFVLHELCSPTPSFITLGPRLPLPPPLEEAVAEVAKLAEVLQEALQVPLEQVWVEEQTLPQRPQLFLSVWKFRQVPEQQPLPEPQLLPQVPQ